MKRFRPVAFWGSLLLLLFLLWLWGRSYFASQLHIYALDGELMLLSIDASDLEYNNNIVDQGPRQAFGYLLGNADSHRQWLGLHWVRGYYRVHLNGNLSGDPRAYRVVTFPIWPLVVVAAVLLAGAFVQRRRVLMRRKQNRCVQCGYDLRATPQRCPECGAVPAGANSASTA